MKKLCFLILCVLSSVFRLNAQDEAYAPPEVISAGDAYASYQFLTDGLFVLDVGLGDKGEITRIRALRDPGSMLGPAKTAVRTWTFRPASEDGKSKASRLTVALVYRPSNSPGIRPQPAKDFVPVISADHAENGSGFLPVGILSFNYPDYPVKSVAWGSVVIQATIDGSGQIKDVKVLHGMAGFNDFALDALKGWRFYAATLRGKPVASKVVIAFI